VSVVVTCRDIGKRFANGVVALSEVALDVHEHEFLSLLGPSGCGKSTLLRLIAGLSEPTGGTIAWQGDPALSFVFQEPTLMPWATALGNVELPLKLAGVGRDERRERATTALLQVGLAGFEKDYPRELSGGMKMRVSIARALVTRPRLLLMDEPFAALDEMTRIKLNNDLLAIWREHRFSIIFVTHSVYESVYLSNRIVVMAPRPGRVIEEIRIDEPYPRGEAFRTSSRYNAHCTAVSQSLHGALHGVDIDH